MTSGYRIGIISDTHGLLRPEAEEALAGCDAILHGGDIDRQDLLDRLGRIAPVYAVRGNADREWAGRIPETLTVRLGGVTFFMIHNRKRIAPGDIEGADAVIYGHTHRYEEQRVSGRLWLNPGSCGPRRFAQPVTMAVMEIGEDGSCWVERMDLSHKGGIPGRTADSPAGCGPEDGAMKIPADIQDRIPLVIKEMKRGRPVAEIAKRAGLSYELTEQICRLYVTHPGVDLDGILRRLGI